MYLDIALIPDEIAWAATILAAIGLAALVRTAEWRALAVPLHQHLVLGSLLGLVALWMISVRTFDGLWLHLLGVTAVTLLIGLRFTLMVGAIACGVHALLIEQPLAGAPVAWLVNVVVPAGVTRLLVQWLSERPQSNLFIYLLGAGFGGGVLASFALVAASLFILSMAGQSSYVSGALENWPMIALIAFPEGFINGMILSVIVVLNPEAVKNFDSDKYLGEG